MEQADQVVACNPYIKEHAVMCLKFLLEGNAENQALVSSLEAREVVPGPAGKEALNNMGVQVGLDKDGKVKVVRREEGSSASASASVRGRFSRLDVKDGPRRVNGEEDEDEEETALAEREQ